YSEDKFEPSPLQSPIHHLDLRAPRLHHSPPLHPLHLRAFQPIGGADDGGVSPEQREFQKVLVREIERRFSIAVVVVVCLPNVAAET
ncbi:hypothetical protein TIFTF001_054398, partial [Ficus carica]